MNTVKRITVCLFLAAIVLFTSVCHIGALTITTVVPNICGDADGDGDITILDVTMIQRRLSNMPNSSIDQKAADVDDDGEVTILDATFIQRYLSRQPCPDRIGKR